MSEWMMKVDGRWMADTVMDGGWMGGGWVDG